MSIARTNPREASLLQDAASRFRHETLFSNACHMTKKALLPLGYFDIWHVFRRDLALPVEPVRSKLPLDLELASATEIDVAADLDGMGARRAERFREWSRQGHSCLAAKVGGEVVGFGWVSFQAMRRKGYLVGLREDEAFLFHMYTARAWRGKRIHGALEYGRLLLAQRAGCKAAYVAVSADNERSAKTFRRGEWEQSGLVLFFRPRPLQTFRVWCLRGSAHPIRPVPPSSAHQT